MEFLKLIKKKEKSIRFLAEGMIPIISIYLFNFYFYKPYYYVCWYEWPKSQLNYGQDPPQINWENFSKWFLTK